MILRTIISFLMLLVSIRPSLASNEARLLTQSSSGQTVVFNLGTQDGIREGDFAVIVKKIRSLDSRDLRVVPVAKAKNIKINPDSSIWILYRIFDQELLVKGDEFLVLSESLLLNGRTDPTLGRVTVVSDSKKIKSTTKYALKDDKDRLSKKKNEYDILAVTHETEYKGDDFDLIDMEKWEKAGSIRYRSALYKSPHEKDFRKQLRVATFEKLVTGYLKKINDPEFNYDSFYDEQMRKEGFNEFRAKTNSDTEFEKFLYQRSQKTSADAKLFRSVLEKGGSWSEDYSDEELGRVLNEVSVLQEKDRRQLVMVKPKRYSTSLDYSTILTDNQGDKDVYRRDKRYSFDLGFEVVPILKHPTLERLTLEGSFRVNKTATETGTYNTAVDEYSLALGANWYPLYSSYTVEAPVLFFGTYIRSGYALLTAPNAREQAKYTVLSVPGFKVGMRYIWRNNINLRIVASMETLRLDQYSASTSNTVLPDSVNLVDGKFGLGLGYSF